MLNHTVFAADEAISITILAAELNARALAHHGNRVWVGTRDGLYTQQTTSLSSFKKIKPYSVNELSAVNDSLLVAHNGGVAVLQEGEWKNYLIGSSYAVTLVANELIVARESSLLFIDLKSSASRSEAVPAVESVYLSSLPRQLCRAKSSLWIGTEFGLHCRLDNGSWRYYRSEVRTQELTGRSAHTYATEGLCGNRIKRLRASQNRILVSTNSGLTSIDKEWQLARRSEECLAIDEGDVAVKYCYGNASLPSNDVRDACFIKGYVAVGTKSGLVLLNSDLKDKKLVNGLPDGEINCLCPALGNHLFVGTKGGLALVLFNS